MARSTIQYLSLLALFIFAAGFGILIRSDAVEASDPPDTWPLSCFVYADIDRNGTYTMSDRPYAGLTIEFQRPDGTTVTKRSNLAGFANFTVGLDKVDEADFTTSGTYSVHAVEPFDWVAIDPAPLSQKLVVEPRDDVGGRLVLSKPCSHIGVAPELFVAGKIDAPDGTQIENITVTATRGNSDAIDVVVNPAGYYRFAASPGIWILEVSESTSGETRHRQIEVGAYNIMVSTISLSRTQPDQASGPSKLVRFDDVTPSDTLYEIPSGYGGLNWLYWIATHNKFYEGYGYINNTVSGEYMAYASSGLPASFWSDKPFDFIGVHVGAAWPRGEEEFAIVRAWKGDDLVYEDSFPIYVAGPVFFDADYRQIDRVEFSHGNHERIVIDDLSYRN